MDPPLSGCAFSNKNILFSERKSNCIFKMDFNLNIIQKFGGDDKLKRPCSLCCEEKLLFICDYGNDRIQILNLDLEFIDTIKLSFHPFSLQIFGNEGIFFYNLITKALIKDYPKLLGRISKIGRLIFLGIVI